MGETADELNYSAPDYGNGTAEDDARTEDATDETEAIRENIEQTRAEMSQTIDQIQERLNPQHVVEQVKETVREATVGKVEDMVSNVTDTARNTGSGIMDTIKSNPIPAAIAGATLGWLFMKSGKAGQQNNQPNYQTSGYSAYGYPAAGSYPPMQHTYYAPQQPGMVGRFVESVKENPIPAAIAGVSIGYMVMQGQGQNKGQQQTNYRYQSYNQQSMGQKAGDVMDRAGHKVGDVASNVGDKVGQVGDKVGQAAGNVGDTVGNIAGNVGSTVGNVAGTVGDTVGNVAGTVGDTVGNIASGAGDAVGNVAEGVQYQARQAKNQLQRMMDENPMMLGAVALAAGAAIGLLLPATQPEKQLMGEARDNLLDKAQTVVQETVDKVSNVAQTVTEEVQHSAKDTVKEVQHTLKQEAKNQGLIGGQDGQQGSQNQASSMPRTDGGMNRPSVMANMTSTQMEQLERQARQDDRDGFMRAAQSFGWNRQICEEVWNYMTHKPSQDEVMRAFEGQSGQQGQRM